MLGLFCKYPSFLKNFIEKPPPKCTTFFKLKYAKLEFGKLEFDFS